MKSPDVCTICDTAIKALLFVRAATMARRLHYEEDSTGSGLLSRSAPLASSLRVGNQHVQLAMLLYEITMYAIDMQGLKIETD
jgi:hypothetical protein